MEKNEIFKYWAMLLVILGIFVAPFMLAIILHAIQFLEKILYWYHIYFHGVLQYFGCDI